MMKRAGKREKGEALGRKALAAMDEAVAEVVRKHRQAKRKLAVWRDGKAVMISPEEAMIVREERAQYRGSKQASPETGDA